MVQTFFIEPLVAVFHQRRVLLVVIISITLTAVTFDLVKPTSVLSNIDFKVERERHPFKTLSSKKLERIAGLSDMVEFKKILKPMLIERVIDTEGNMMTQEHIKFWMGERLGWTIDEDSFMDETPYGVKNFRNIIATQNPSARRFLSLACHFDSKYFANKVFIGATDSAVPCAMMIDLARTLNYSLWNGSGSAADGVSLQFIFFDGEEALVHWTNTDSIYGARHLAQEWHTTPHHLDPQSTVLHGLDAIVLLDLIGATRPTCTFRNFFLNTDRLYRELASIEVKLHKGALLEDHRSSRVHFPNDNLSPSHIEDDHVPFLRKGVPIVHLICTPFPSVWHKVTDNESALHYPTINNFNKILRIFVFKYLHLSL